MNIQIKRNTFVQPGQSRNDIVQKICDTAISNIEKGQDLIVALEGEHPKLFIGVSKFDSSRVVITNDPYQSHCYLTRIRSCEMRLAFRLMQDAGYYAYKLSDGWKYIISDRPYLGQMRATYIDFTMFID